MTMFGEDELAAALVASAEESGGGGKLARVGDAALNELLHRLEDPVTAAELPGTGLLNIANAYVKAREKQIENEANADTGPPRDEVDVILESNLPDERKRTLLEAALERAQGRCVQLLTLLEGDLNEQR